MLYLLGLFMLSVCILLGMFLHVEGYPKHAAIIFLAIATCFVYVTFLHIAY